MTRTFKLVSAGMGVAAMLGLMGASSFANFTTQGQDGGGNNSFKAGHLGIAASGGNGYIETSESYNANYATVDDTVQNMSPGDTWTKTLTVTNNGSLPELYQVQVTPQGQLFQHAQFKGWGGTLSNYYPATVTITGVDATTGDSVTLINGAYDENAQTSSQWIELDPGASDVMTVSVTLPYDANNAYQNTSGDFPITLTAQQADNSPNSNGAIQLSSTAPDPSAATDG